MYENAKEMTEIERGVSAKKEFAAYFLAFISTIVDAYDSDLVRNSLGLPHIGCGRDRSFYISNHGKII